MGNRCFRPTKAARASDAAAEAQTSAVVLVVDTEGAALFGPAALSYPTTVQQLKGKLPAQRHDLCHLALGPEKLADDFVLRGGNMENPLLITSVVVPNFLRRLNLECLRTLQQRGSLITPPPCFSGFAECIYIAATYRFDDGPGSTTFCSITHDSDLLLLPDGRFLARQSKQVHSSTAAKSYEVYQLLEGTFEVQPAGGQSIRLQMLRAARHRSDEGRWLAMEPTSPSAAMLPWEQQEGQPDQVAEVDLLKLPITKAGRGAQLPGLHRGASESLQLRAENVPFWTCEPGWGQAIPEIMLEDNDAGVGRGTHT